MPVEARFIFAGERPTMHTLSWPRASIQQVYPAQAG
jgi:hypothetical protein